MSSYSSQNSSVKHKQRCEHQEKTATKTSNESHFYGKKYLHKNPFCFWVYADFEADNETDNYCVGNKTNYIQKSPKLNGYCIVSELKGDLQSGYYASLLGYDNVDWLVDEVLKEKKEIFL